MASRSFWAAGDESGGDESLRGLNNHGQAEAGIFARGSLLGLADGALGLGDEGRDRAARLNGRFGFGFGYDHKFQVQSAMASGRATGRPTAADGQPR